MKYKFITFFTILSVLSSCGGGGGGGGGESSADNITYCVTSDATQDASLGFNKPLAAVSDLNVIRDTEALINELPENLGDIPSDYLYLLYTGETENKVDALYKKDDSELGVAFGFFVEVSGDSRDNVIIYLPIYGNEGWLREGKYIESSDINGLAVSVNDAPYVCDSESEYTAIIDNIGYVGGRLSNIDMRFAIKCQSKSIAGRIHWTSDEILLASEPEAIPNNYWSPPSHISSLQNTHLYFVDQNGREFLYTQLNTIFNVQQTKEEMGSIAINYDIEGALYWQGLLTTMHGVNELKVGLYNIDNNNFEKSQMFWYYRGIIYHDNPFYDSDDWPVGCVIKSSSYVVDRSEYSESGDLEFFSLRFSYECEDGTSAHGQFLWDKDDPTQPLGPTEIPENLWDVEQNRTLNDGNYLYIEGDEGEYLSQGVVHEYSYDDAQFILEDYGRFKSFKVLTDRVSSLWLAKMPSLEKYEKGFYGPFDFYDNHNPALGFVQLSLENRSSENGQGGGWYAIDHIAYDGDSISEIIVRFEYITDYLGRASRGKLFWSKNSANPSNPKTIPTDIWKPSEKLENSCGQKNTLRLQIQDNSWWNYMYDLGATVEKPAYIVFDNIVGGHVNFPSAGTWEIIFSAQTLRTSYPKVDGSDLHINGTYLQDKLEVGFYSDIMGNNPAKGAIDLSLDSYMCDAQNGWMAVDDVVYGEGSELKKLKLRFGFACESLFEVLGSPSVYGQLDWEK